MISITARGRLAFQPELKLIGNGAVCEFRLLSTRLSRGQEITEAVTFVCYDDVAEEFCSGTVKGQEVEATGVQETAHYEKDGVKRQYVKYRLTWFRRGRKPRMEGTYSEAPEQRQGQGSYDQPGQRPNRFEPRDQGRPTHQGQPTQREVRPPPPPDYEMDDDGPPYY